MDTSNTAPLRREITVWGVASLGISASIGVSILSIFGPASSLAGPGVLISIALALAPMAVFLVVYAFMASAVPVSGASYVWPSRFIHPFVGFMVAWLRILSNVGGAAIMATVFADYLSKIIDLPRPVVTITLLTALHLLNALGVALSGRTTSFLVVLKLAGLAVFIAFGLPNVRWENFTPMAPYGGAGILAALPLVAGLFGGIESAAEVGGEVRRGRTATGQGMALAAGASFLIYVAVATISIGVLGAPGVAASKAALADAGETFLGGQPARLGIVLVALVSVAAALNTLILITSRFIFAMGVDGVLPRAIGKVHPKTGVPYVALALIYVLSLGALALLASLTFLFLATNIPTILKYGTNCISAWRLVGKFPSIHAEAAFPLSRLAVRIWSGAGLFCALGILAAGWNVDRRAYALLVAWAALGVIYWLVRGRRSDAAEATPAAG